MKKTKIHLPPIKVNISKPEKSWRLVHDGVNVLDLFESTGETSTINNLFCAPNRKAALAEIKRLGLRIAPVL